MKLYCLNFPRATPIINMDFFKPPELGFLPLPHSLGLVGRRARAGTGLAGTHRSQAIMGEGLGPWGVLSTPAGLLLHIKTIYPIPLVSSVPSGLSLGFRPLRTAAATWGLDGSPRLCHVI